MASVPKQQILQQAHSILVEHCVFNGLSHNLMNALTRDIYPSNISKQHTEFHLNIKKCKHTFNSKYNHNINMSHFAQLQWISTLQKRPCSMLPTAHHLIEFFNDINHNHNYTQSIQQQFIIQCLISMNLKDKIQWNKYIQQYYTLLNNCLDNKSLHAFKISNYPWNIFANKLSKWCINIINTLQLTPNKSLLYQYINIQNKNNNNNKQNDNINTQSRKRRYNEMNEYSSISKSHNRRPCKRARTKVSNNNKWANWIQKNINVTLELNDEFYCGIIRKVSMQFVLVKITDDDAPNKYKNKQFKIYINDKHKIEPIHNINDLINDLVNNNYKHENKNDNKNGGNNNNNNNSTNNDKNGEDYDNNNNNNNVNNKNNNNRENMIIIRRNTNRIVNQFYGNDKKKNSNNKLIWKKLMGHNRIGKPKKKKRKVRKRIAWNKQEINAVVNGYKKYKKYANARKFQDGIWGHILKDPKFSNVLNINHRTNAQIRDKWRHLVTSKDKRIKHLIDDKNKNNISPRDKMRKLVTKAL